MWLYLNPDFTINTYIKEPRDIKIDNISHPKNIFTLWNDDELNGIRIYKVICGESYDPSLMECVSTRYEQDGKVFKEIHTLQPRAEKVAAKNETLKNLKETLELYASRMDELSQAIAQIETAKSNLK